MALARNLALSLVFRSTPQDLRGCQPLEVTKKIATKERSNGWRIVRKVRSR